jgi:hypothetical protein
VIQAVAQAWNQLAVLGVETADLRHILNDSIHNAFTAIKSEGEDNL